MNKVVCLNLNFTFGNLNKGRKSSEIISFLKNVKILLKNISGKYSQTLCDGANKESATDAIKTASNRVIQKTAEATGDLIGNKVDDKIVSASKKSPKDLSSTMLHSNEANHEIPKERYLSIKERQQVIDELRLI